MAASLYSFADYKAALLALLPSGRAWPKAPGSEVEAVMAGLAPTLVRLDARAQTLLADAFPGSTVQLLPEWEETLGLPDPCEGESQGLEQRRAQVVTRFASGGGQSIAYFLGVLSRLGYTEASIEQYAPFRTDRSSVDAPLYGQDWIFAWRVNLPELRIFYFQADISAADEPLSVVSNDVAVCVLPTLKPAHTVLLFSNDEVASQLDLAADPDNAIYTVGL